MPAPTVLTQICGNTIAEKTTGHGVITAFGDSDVTQHGHCYGTSSNPDTSGSKTTLGAAPNLGQFQSDITGLTPGTHYYIRAYATNTTGTSYGINVEIDTGGTIGNRDLGVRGKNLHYFDEHGTERKIDGVAVTGDSDLLTYMLG